MKTYQVVGSALRVTEIVDFTYEIEAHSDAEARHKGVIEASKELHCHPSMVEVERVRQLDKPAPSGA